MPAYSEERKLEQPKDNSKPMAVYHYTALVSKQFHGPIPMDGVITIPVIAGSNDYNAVKELIAMECGVDDSFRVQVKSLSFVGETAVYSVTKAQEEQSAPLAQQIGNDVISVTSISFSGPVKEADGSWSVSGRIDWSDGVQRDHPVWLFMEVGEDPADDVVRNMRAIGSQRIVEFANTMCAPDSLKHR